MKLEGGGLSKDEPPCDLHVCIAPAPAAMGEGMFSGKQYAERDCDDEDLCSHYMRHLEAMTGESLHSKAAIAWELAWRDQRYAPPSRKSGTSYATNWKPRTAGRSRSSPRQINSATNEMPLSRVSIR